MRERAQLNLKIYLSMGSKMYDFLSKMHVSDLIWELPDLIWHLLDRKVSVLDGRSADF